MNDKYPLPLLILLLIVYAIIMLSAISIFYRKRKFNNNRIQSRAYTNGEVELEHITMSSEDEVEGDEEED